MFLETIPPEIIDLICHHCDVEHIKSIRQTCRTLQCVADEHLFPEIRLFMNDESLEACRHFSSHEGFRRSPTCLWVQADRPIALTYKDWIKELEENYVLTDGHTPPGDGRIAQIRKIVGNIERLDRLGLLA